ncbi:MAG: RpiB/LacA/LacB family sugar-phosphate isomerase, partial [Planctomycetota bacterium]|nr:RpiB/LacA/LacB family sugar-phosphate isomerase [Planctomycetota bacterium]
MRRIQFVSDGWHPTARRVAVGADHGGFELKGHVIAELQALGIEACDVGTHSTAACDYPDFALAVARAVSEGRVDLGVMIDGVGIGSAMAANRVPGVLAANCWDERTARSAREHNYANVLTLGAAHLDARTL